MNHFFSNTKFELYSISIDKTIAIKFQHSVNAANNFDKVHTFLQPVVRKIVNNFQRKTRNINGLRLKIFCEFYLILKNFSCFILNFQNQAIVSN